MKFWKIISIFVLLSSVNANAAIVEFTYTSDSYGELGSFTIDDSILDGSSSQFVSNTNIIDLNFSYNGTALGVDDVVTTASTIFDSTDFNNIGIANGAGTLASNATGNAVIFSGGYFILGSYTGYGSWSSEAPLTSVPVPAAAWLFGSGLLGLAGFARRKKI